MPAITARAPGAAAPALRRAPRRPGRHRLRAGRARPALPAVPLPHPQAGPAPREHAPLRRPPARGRLHGRAGRHRRAHHQPSGAGRGRRAARAAAGDGVRRRGRLAQPRPDRGAGRRGLRAARRGRPRLPVLPHDPGPAGRALRRRLGPRGRSARMQHFYSWQRKRLDVLVTDTGDPVGGRWSFDEDNRKKLPRSHPVPRVSWPGREERHPHVEEAIAWVRRAFPDNPGDPGGFGWPTDHAGGGGVVRASSSPSGSTSSGPSRTRSRPRTPTSSTR